MSRKRDRPQSYAWVRPLPRGGPPEEEEAPAFEDWRETWEWYAERTHRAYMTWSEDDLLTAIRRRRYDLYYQLWHAIGEKGTLEKSAPVLIEVLRRERRGTDAMLLRHHCAGALFSLLGYPDRPMPPLRERVQWDLQGEPARLAAIKELEKLVRERIRAAADAGDQPAGDG
jgi:hypothetical protein